MGVPRVQRPTAHLYMRQRKRPLLPTRYTLSIKYNELLPPWQHQGGRHKVVTRVLRHKVVTRVVLLSQLRWLQVVHPAQRTRRCSMPYPQLQKQSRAVS